MMHRFIEKELNSLYRYCCALTLQESDAYDLLQTALEKYLRHCPPHLDKPLGYMRRIIRNAHIDNLRRNRLIEWQCYQDDVIDSTDMGWQSLEQMVVNENEVKIILKALNGAEREILFLWAVEGYTVQEVADLIDIPKNSVLSKIYRMRQRINATYQSGYSNGAK